MEFPQKEEKYPISHSCNIWFHQPFNKNWESSSYKLLHSFDSLRGFMDHFHGHKPHAMGMYFLMKDPIVPTWEDKHNQKGGCWTFRIDKKVAFSAWLNISMAFVGNTLMKNIDDMEYINGVSATFRKRSAVIKIWNSCRKSNPKLISDEIRYIDLNASMFKIHEGRK